jgi:hypothetical protein
VQLRQSTKVVETVREDVESKRIVFTRACDLDMVEERARA